MSPDQLAKFQEMYDDFAARKSQQLRYPVDEASRNALGAAIGSGQGNSTLTQTITIGAGGGSASVPAAYAGSFLLTVEGVTYEIGYIRTI